MSSTTIEVPRDITSWKEIDWKRLIELNIKKLPRLMRAQEVDALIVQSLDNFQYITGYRVPASINLMDYLHRQGAILPAEEDQPIMLVGANNPHSTGVEKPCSLHREQMRVGSV